MKLLPALAAGLCAGLVFAEPPPPGDTAPDAPLDFPAAVDLALRRSPRLRQGFIQVEVVRMDERDGRAGYWPAIHLHASYLVDAPVTVDDPATLFLTTGEYNPVGAHFTTRARREITRLAQIAQLQGIADGLRQLGELFLTLDALDRAQAIQADQMEWATRHVAWCTNRLDQPGALLDLQAAEQDMIAVRLEGVRTTIRRRQTLRALAELLGFGADEELPALQTATARAWLRIDADSPNRDDAEDRALDLRILEIQLRLQRLGVKGAYADYLPRPTFNVRTADPLDDNAEDGWYVTAGLSIPLWDGGRRRTQICRQKAVLEQKLIARDHGRDAWKRGWDQAADLRELAAADAALAAQRVRLAQLNLSRIELAQQAGREEWPALKSAQQLLAAARLAALEQELAADRAALALRHLGRELLDRFVAVSNLIGDDAGGQPEEIAAEPEK
jgi:outer membrane protein TolC